MQCSAVCPLVTHMGPGHTGDIGDTGDTADWPRPGSGNTEAQHVCDV